MPIGAGATSVGRTTDNDVSFPNDSNVSRYHAEIQNRGGEFWLKDLGSSNGTSVNGLPLKGERRLGNDDSIVLGGTSRIAISIEDDPVLEPEQNSADEFGSLNLPVDIRPASMMPEAVSNSHSTLIMAGAAGGLVIVVLVVVGTVYLLSGSRCDAAAVVSKPESGDTIIAATEIEVDVENAGCVSRAVFSIDGVEFAAAAEPPFSATIDPKEFPDLADGFDHTLTVTLEDESGTPIAAKAPVLLAFESREIAKPPVMTQTTQASTQPLATAQAGRQVSLIDVQEMSKRLVKQFPASAAYSVSNKQFLQEVQKKTAEYAQDGYSERGARYRDAINVAFVREQNMPAPLGFLVAMSRSKFMPEKQGADEGMWRMNSAFAAANGYIGLCGTETLSDPSQNCAAKAAAVYMKALVLGVFDGDVVYSVAAFGKSPQDAGVWKASLGANRADLWNTIKTPPEREQLVRFFAAGIVAENPQKFGLKKDRPLSELYRLAM